MDLTTKDRYLMVFPDDAKAWAGNTAFLSLRISSVSASVERYLQRSMENTERTQKFTPQNGSGTLSLRLNGAPVEAVDEVKVFDTVLTTDEYEIDQDTGLIQLGTPVHRDSTPYLNKISVTYTGGMADDTADFISKYPDIEMVVIMQISFELKRAKTITDKRSANGVTTTDMNPYGFLDETMTVLNRYRFEYVV